VRKLPVLLIVDDEENVCDTLEAILYADFHVFKAQNAKKALRIIADENIDLILLDIKLPDMSGMEILRRVKESDPSISVIMATAVDSVKSAVEAMQSGAFSYIAKPFDADQVSAVCQKAIKNKRLLEEVTSLRSQQKEIDFRTIIGESSELKEILKIVLKLAETDSTILIQGESGTGKELIARAIHFNSPRRQKSFIAINCAAIPENLIESELFGYEKGAFTDARSKKLGVFELAKEGTLFLDDVSDLRIEVQAKLLRALEEKEFRRVGGTKNIKIDARILSASNVDLKKAVAKGVFRSDLFYRLNVVPICLPALRERRSDIPMLIRHFIAVYNTTLKKSIAGINDEALELLTSYDWPGNIRELRNIIERIIALKDEGFIIARDLPMDISLEASLKKGLGMEGGLKDACAEFQKHYITEVLVRVGGNQSQAARIFGIHRNALRNKIKLYRIGVK